MGLILTESCAAAAGGMLSKGFDASMAGAAEVASSTATRRERQDSGFKAWRLAGYFCAEFQHVLARNSRVSGGGRKACCILRNISKLQ